MQRASKLKFKKILKLRTSYVYPYSANKSKRWVWVNLPIKSFLLKRKKNVNQVTICTQTQRKNAKMRGINFGIGKIY